MASTNPRGQFSRAGPMAKWFLPKAGRATWLSAFVGILRNSFLIFCMTSSPHFDEYAFAGKRVRAVSQESHLSFNDFGKMHVEFRVSHIKRRKIVEWANDAATLRNVILTFLERRYNVTVPPGSTDLARVEAINFKAAADETNRKLVLEERLDAYKEALDRGDPPRRIRELEIEVQNSDSRARFDRRPVELTTSIVWLSYRLGWNSVQVAQELHILSPHVRIILYRLCKIAHDIETGRVYRPRRSRKGIKPRRWRRRELAKLWRLRAEGLSWQKCAVKLGRLSQAGNGSKLIPLYKRFFERDASAGDRWTCRQLEGLCVLRHCGKTWQECGKVYGLTVPGIRAAYLRHFPS